MLRPTIVMGIACAGLTGLAPAVRANPASIVPSVSPAPGTTTHVLVGIDYAYEQDAASIVRERAGGDPLGPLPLAHEFEFHQFRHLITPHADIGIFKDTWVSVALPIVIAQARELHLASGADRASLSTVSDGILPAAGFDARDPGTPPPGDLMFRGVDRHGLDQLDVGLNVAPMNQARDDTKPTWKLGAELRLAVGKVMKYDAMAPGANTAVGRGVHELRLWTSFDRRLGWAEPWFTMFWQVPLGVTSGSLFQDPGFGATNTGLGQQAGIGFGFEAYALDDAEDGNRISLDLGTRLVAHFEGRDYSEMWEVFASAGDSRGMGPLVIDADPTKMGVQPASHPGITNIENYLQTAAQLAIRAELGPHVRFAVTGNVSWRTDHVITFADSGVDQPTCTASQTTGCETDDNDVINPGTAEVNPLHVRPIDLVGHRYHSQHDLGVAVAVQGEVLF